MIMDLTAFEKPLSVKQPVVKRITGWILTFRLMFGRCQTRIWAGPVALDGGI